MSAARRPAASATHSWRRWCVLGILALCAVAVQGRAFYLQVFEQEFLQKEGDKRHIRTVSIPGHRGAILDRRGEPLALSAPVESIWVVPAALLDAPEHLEAIARLTARKPAELTAFLKARSERKFVYLAEKISPAQAQRILAVKAPGVFSEPSYARYYPAGEVAGQVVGFTGRDGDGLEGLERAQQALLAGQAGSRRVVRDRAGRVVEDFGTFKPAQSGQDLRLTLDLRIQYLAYRELKAAVVRHKAKGGLVVVADSRTGEILAMASQPGFNPNNPEDRRAAGIRNRSVADSFEPGSTVKPLLVAQALELGLYRAGSMIDTAPGMMKVGALTVRDLHPQGEIDLGVMLAKSSNVGAAKIGLRLGAEHVWSGYQRFGLGEPVYTGFPGEAVPVLRHFTEWGQIATATASYGYGLSLNALHLVRAYSALANNGLMPMLSLIKGLPQAAPQRTVSERTARDVRHLLEQVVSADGTGKRAAISGYRVAGKSGTVRKVADGGGYDRDRHQAVFIGMVPAENPRLVGLVMIDEPQAGDYYGGLVSAPVFSTVMQGAARLLQVAPDGAQPPTRTAALANAEARP
ncbi:MAG: peptidoglycan D,D-transpeptidase FtsI family protein [Gammaproteobacteria bacterium]